ncbi:hypothetical protein Kfla_3525 [Kribbella flavida DSM 17836]|uniref:Uncharacterized protein n=1 Tax=Kribbella flavida (strain DSM 17836 / JCM 10339 / NBRC 14399) TaxID=479435 RepID=D2PM03_KRIFD|nr:hypothetical protein [Kribbella flavida]ADB32583.1 hypothetical protein Kfla_3525 [Kribbella flavida DSM 17836]
MEVLGIPVPPSLVTSWVDWLAPDRQPFYVTARQATEWDLPLSDEEPDPQLRDTYRVYDLDGELWRSWLSEAEFLALPDPTRAKLVRAQTEHGRDAVPTVRAWKDVLGPRIREQADGHRFVWWKSLLSAPDAVLRRIVSDEFEPSRHTEVQAEVWRDAARLVPRARELAGTFAQGSGPNCFGTVMAACGVEGAESQWVQRQPFDTWLAESATRGGRDGVPGTVLVWRSSDGAVQHAAVTLGSGWALHKPSQAWASPRKVRTVDEILRASRRHGWRLQRHSLDR